VSSLSAYQNRGFTLVELVTVMVILGVLASIGSGFVIHSAESQQKTQQRQDLFQRSRVSLNIMARQLENALPNSLRTNANGSCVEFIPLVGGGLLNKYVSDDENNAPAQNKLNVLAYTIDRGIASYVAVAGLSNTDIYSGNSVVGLQNPIGVGSGSGDVNLQAAHRFSRNSNSRRVFFLAQPKSFCFYQGSLYEYSAYGAPVAAIYTPTQKGGLLAQDIAAQVGQFTLRQGVEDVNTLLNIKLGFVAGGDRFDVTEQVFIRNVP